MTALKEKLQINISDKIINTLINASGCEFSSEKEICNYLRREYNILVSQDDIARLFATEREIEDRIINYKMFTNT